MRRFVIALADSDRGLYEELDLRVAQHPSESERYLVARVLARVLEHAEGVEFSKGLSVDDEPAIFQRDLRGDVLAWIEVGQPSPDRLHKASKTGARVAVYGWKAVDQQAIAIAERGVHRADQLALYALAPELLDGVAATLDRNNKWDLSIVDGTIYLTIGEASFEGAATRVAIP